MKKLKITLAAEPTFRDQKFSEVKRHADGSPVEPDEDALFGEDYVPPKNPAVVDKCIEILNGLCRKYAYAVLKDHDIVSDNELEFFIDYKFNGKELGVIRISLDRNSGNVWTARCYLSVKKATRLPITNLANFISDFRKLIRNLHIVCSENTHNRNL